MTVLGSCIGSAGSAAQTYRCPICLCWLATCSTCRPISFTLVLPRHPAACCLLLCTVPWFMLLLFRLAVQAQSGRIGLVCWVSYVRAAVSPGGRVVAVPYTADVHRYGDHDTVAGALAGDATAQAGLGSARLVTHKSGCFTCRCHQRFSGGRGCYEGIWKAGCGGLLVLPGLP